MVHMHSRMLVTFYLAAALVAAASCSPDLASLSAVEAVAGLCSRKFTAVQYTEALLKQARTFECLNAWKVLDPERVLKDAAAVDARAAAGEDVRPLCGLPFAVKDVIDVVGYPTVMGTPSMEGRMPLNNSIVVAKILAGNGVIYGKTNTAELASSPITINPVYGAVLNAYDNLRHSSGSSGGSGAVVAARVAPVAFCTDTGGSCRAPGGASGVIGWRPSVGCWPAGDAIQPNNNWRDTVGVISRTVDDVIFWDKFFGECELSSSYEEVVSLEGLRLGYPTHWWSVLDEEARPAFAKALDALKAAGAELVEYDVSELDDFYFEIGGSTKMDAYEAPREMSRYLYMNRYRLSVLEVSEQIATPGLREFGGRWMLNAKIDDPGPALTPEGYWKHHREVLPKLVAMFEGYFEEHNFDAYIQPNLRVAAPPIYAAEPFVTINGKKLQHMAQFKTGASGVDDMCRAPSIGIPIGTTAAGMPLGIMVTGKHKTDAKVLAISKAISGLMPQVPPPPSPPRCTGCTHKIGTQEVTYKGVGTPGPDDTTSYFTISFEGTCPYAKHGLYTERTASSVRDEL